MTTQRPNWHELAEQASKELDPTKLKSLVDEHPCGYRLSNLFDISARLGLSPTKARFLGRAFPFT